MIELCSTHVQSIQLRTAVRRVDWMVAGDAASRQQDQSFFETMIQLNCIFDLLVAACLKRQTLGCGHYV